MPLISVIIPTYKHRDYVRATLESVFAQVITDYEIIVVNDGSPDDTAAVLEPLIRAGRINYIEQPNAGQAAARNRGLREARGQFIAFLDDDDLWPDDKLQWQVDALQSDPGLGAVAGYAVRTDEKLRPLGTSRYVPEITFRSLFLGNPILSPGQTLIRADLLRELGGFNESIWGADDWDLWFRITRQSRMQMHDRVALTYRVHPGNASRNLRRMLANTRQVLRTHLPALDPSVARRLRRPIRRWLYNYLGSEMAGAARLALSQRRLRDALRHLGDMSTVAAPALWDPVLAAAVARDMLPTALRRRLGAVARGVRGRRAESDPMKPSLQSPPA